MSEQQPDYRAVAAKIRAAGVAVEAQMTALRKENAELRAELSRLQAGGQGVFVLPSASQDAMTVASEIAAIYASSPPGATSKTLRAAMRHLEDYARFLAASKEKHHG